MRLINAQTQQVEDVPDEQAQDAFQGGTHQLVSGTKVPVRLSTGELGTVDPSEVSDILNEGGSLAPKEVGEIQDQSKYGGGWQQAKTVAEGLGRGVTAGLSTKAETALGIATPEDIAGRERVNPIEATGSEIVGFAAPVAADILSGGTLTPEIAAAEGTARAGAGVAEAAGAVKGLAGAARNVLQYTPAAAIGKAGAFTEAAVSKVLGTKIASSALGRVLATAGAGSIEGGLFGAGNQVNMDALDSQPTTADKLYGAFTHNALTGLLLGGGFGVASELASPIMRKAAPYLDRQASELAVDSLKIGKNELGGFTKKEVGSAAREYDWVNNPTKAAQDHAAMGDKVSELADRAGASVNGEKVREALRDVDPDLKTRIEHEFLGGPKVEGTAPIRRTSQEIEDFLGKNPELAKRWAVEKEMGVEDASATSQKILFKEASKALPAYDLSVKQVGALIDQVGGHNRLVGRLENLRDGALKQVPKSLEGEDLAQFKKLQKDQEIAGVVAKGAGKAEKEGTPLWAKAMGSAELLMHPHAIPFAVGGYVAKRLLEAKGAGLASQVLGKVSKLDMLARASQEVDRELGNSVKVLSGRAKPKVRIRRFSGPDETSPPSEKADYATEHSQPKVVTPDDLDRAIPGLSEHAPNTANALVQKVNAVSQYLAAQRPKPLNQPSLLDPTAKPRYSEVDTEKYFETVRAAQDPVGTLSQAFEDGHIGQHEVDAVKMAIPDLFADLQKNIFDELAHPKVAGKISPESAQVVSKLFGVPADGIYAPQTVMAMQGSFSTSDQGSQDGNPGAAHQMKGAALGKVNVVKGLVNSSKLPLDKVASR